MVSPASRTSAVRSAPTTLKPQLHFYQTYSKVGLKWRWRHCSREAHTLSPQRAPERGSGLLGVSPGWQVRMVRPARSGRRRAPLPGSSSPPTRPLPGRPARGRSLRPQPRPRAPALVSPVRKLELTFPGGGTLSPRVRSRDAQPRGRDPLLRKQPTPGEEMSK